MSHLDASRWLISARALLHWLSRSLCITIGPPLPFLLQVAALCSRMNGMAASADEAMEEALEGKGAVLSKAMAVPLPTGGTAGAVCEAAAGKGAEAAKSAGKEEQPGRMEAELRSFERVAHFVPNLTPSLRPASGDGVANGGAGTSEAKAKGRGASDEEAVEGPILIHSDCRQR